MFGLFSGLSRVVGYGKQGLQSVVQSSAVKQHLRQTTEDFVQKESKAIGKAVEQKFRDMLYQDTSLSGKVVATGQEVKIYTNQPLIVRKIMQKAGLDTMISGVPGFVVNPILKKSDDLLVNMVGQYIDQFSR